jgi:1,6-anhydro-N-acetylmuramate kinase
MTGTSIDGLDAALIEARGRGLSMHIRILEHRQWPLGDLARDLRDIAEQKPMTAEHLAATALRFGEFHAACLAEMLGGRRIDLVAAHGQTVFHRPPVSLQMLNPFPIAARLGCAVVSDLRQADLIAGGQGAPITPLADWVLMRGENPRAIINLGGFCNITMLPACPAGADAGDASLLDRIAGMDVCACNHVLDAVARTALGVPFDEDGRAAAAGRADPVAARELADALAAQARGGRSLGTGDEAARWVERHRSRITGPDLAASAVAALAEVIARAVGGKEAGSSDPATREIYLAGGGAKNKALITALAAAANRPARSTELLGVPGDAREAAEIAVLGLLASDGVEITLPRITGRRRPAGISGSWLNPHSPSISRTF